MRKILLILIILLFCSVFFGAFFVLRRERPVEFSQKGGETKEVGIKMDDEKKKRVLLVIAPRDFRDEEYLEPRKILEEAGIKVAVASKGLTAATGKFGAVAPVDLDLGEVRVEDYDAVVFIGGPGASIYFDDQQALSLAKTAYDSGKIVGAICIAPSILANAGILSGKKATAFSSELDNLNNRGAQYSGEPVTVDDKIITARGSEAAVEFGEKLVEVLEK